MKVVLAPVLSEEESIMFNKRICVLRANLGDLHCLEIYTVCILHHHEITPIETANETNK